MAMEPEKNTPMTVSEVRSVRNVRKVMPAATTTQKTTAASTGSMPKSTPRAMPARAACEMASLKKERERRVT